MMDAQDWLNKAKERSTKATWILNRISADDPNVAPKLIEAADELHTAYQHCQDAAKKLGVELL